MTGKLPTYLPQDRRRALGRGESLPDHARGSALFADISGFTPLTEKLTQQFGARRGVEELTQRINVVYDALIHVVDQYGGSVISFAGDAITCWFDAMDEARRMKNEEVIHSSFRTAACALAMQQAMHAFPDLSVKITVTSGDGRRLVVGDPQIQLIDTLAGATIARLATAEHLAQRGEVVVDSFTVEACDNALQIRAWRQDAETQERFALIGSLAGVEPGTESISFDDIPPEILRPWVPTTVYAREQSGLGEFLTELRPAVALFLRFSGIDYDGDESAQAKLDAFIRQVQRVVTRYEGTLLQLTIGDKGSYVCVCFGAPTAHEDDARRAVNAALALRAIPRELTFLREVQIGISRGILRTGAYGGTTRRTYGAQGDEVNLAARLMSMAVPNEILLSGRVQQLLGEQFALEPRPPLPLKGKAEPLPVFAVTGVQQRRATRLLEPTYRLPMMGRQNELALIANKLELTRQGQGQTIGLTAEAGMGKSRLVAETIRLAQRQGFAGYGGACESSGTNTAYLVWKAIWQAFFDVDPTALARRQVRHLEAEFQDRAPQRLQAMPLLAPILDLQIEDNDFTRTLEPKDRRNVLMALFEDCLKAAAKEEPILFVLEDVHWIDPLSHDLLESLTRATTNFAICFVLAYRPPELERLQAPRVEALANFTKIELHELVPADAEQLIRAKLAQLFPERGGGLPKALTDQVIGQAEGNPFFIEELLNYLRDRGISPYDEHALNLLELPSSLQTLILSRVDQLTESQKVTLKVASIIGRLFPFAWLRGYYPVLGASDAVKADLDVLSRLDITPLDTPEPELAYLFKHVVTQEVAYESLAYATRAQLHEQLAQYFEARDADKYLDLLAFHYGRSENVGKQREYFRKAGDAAQKNFANDAALDYYGKLLPLLKDGKAQAEIHLKRGQVLELMGKWAEAEKNYRAGLDSAKDDMASVADAQYALGRLSRLRGNYASALDWLVQAKETRTLLGDAMGLAQVLVEIGLVLFSKGEFVQAREPLNKGLALARQAGDRLKMARALNALGSMACDQGDYPAARALLEESLALSREMSDQWGISASLNNLGLVVMFQGDHAVARALYQESLALDREMGDKWGVAVLLGNLGLVAVYQDDRAAARALYEESLALSRQIGNKKDVANILSNLGLVANMQGDYATARALFEECFALCREIDDKSHMANALLGLGLVDLAESKPEAREQILHSLRLRQETGEQLLQTSSLIGTAGLASHEGNLQFAAQLLGAVESALKTLNAAMEPELKPFYTQTLAAVRESLGESAFNAAFEAGQKMSLDEAVKLALEEN